jgi:glycerol-3-phosphate dehydrogenase (NAD(P)+)
MRVGVVGAGSWGTALAKVAAEAGHQVSLWAFEPEVARQIAEERVNTSYLPGVELPPLHLVSSELEPVVAEQDLLLSVMPSHVVREVWTSAAPLLRGEPLLVSATKGIEMTTLATMAEVLREVLPRRVAGARLAVLSGPSFAVEVARRQPTAVVVASRDPAVAQAVQHALAGERLRVYTSDDVPGVEVGGAAKNVVAIAAGIAAGLELGHNALAALITRGLAEITRLAVAKAANPLTLAGLAGMGDLVLTCTGELSRNRAVGLALGRGQRLEEIQAGRRSVAEGVRSASSCHDLARRLGVEMPITEAVHAVLYEGLSPLQALHELMGRQLRGELDKFAP